MNIAQTVLIRVAIHQFSVPLVAALAFVTAVRYLSPIIPVVKAPMQGNVKLAACASLGSIF